jgi:phosphatidylglycerol:prolipoprotein diacylglycerol transferase
MHPVLFQIFGFSVPSYGFLLALSFLVGAGLAAWRANRAGLNAEAILDLAILIILGASAGSRIYYVVLHWEEFQGDWIGALIPLPGSGQSAGGLVFYGGFLGGLTAASLYLWLKRYSFAAYADASAPSIALGLALTRVGCFLNGCCHGREWGGPLSVRFPAASPAGRFQEEVQAAGLHPSQLYESFGALLLFLVLLFLGRRWARWRGFQFAVLILSYGVVRFLVDFTRFYDSTETMWGFSHNQIVSLLLVAAIIPLAGRSVRRSLRGEPLERP